MKIAIFFENGKFLGDIIDYLKKTHEVKTFSPKQTPSNQNELKRMLKDLYELMIWSDLSWFEWCDELAIYGSRLSKRCKVVIRLHYSEVYSNMPDQVNWENVDDLIFVAEHVREVLKKKIFDLENRVKTHIIHNGINLERFNFKERKNGHHLAYVGYLNHKKNPSLLLQCIKCLVDVDPNYKLHIAGFHEQTRYQLYFENLVRDMGIGDNVKLYGWVDKVSDWLEDKDYILSTSIGEGCPVGIMEAMARGIKPLIHNWPGARDLYPDRYIFNTISEFKNMVLNGNYNSTEYREYIEDNYSLEKQLREIDKILL
ncbi:TPA: hypothetical protein DCX15_02440 [bacterium]|nr:hypothetical protein [bacterium]